METSLFDLHFRCHLSFQALLSALDSPKRNIGDQMLRRDVESEFDKYRLWAGNVGAIHSGDRYNISLDYRLRESPFYRDRITSFITTLKQNILRATAIVSNELKPIEEMTILDLETGSDGDEAEDHSSDGSPWSEESNLDPPETSHNNAPVGMRVEGHAAATILLQKNPLELPRLMEMIRFTVACLYKMPIRRPAALERLKNNLTGTASFFQHFDVLYVQDLFPQMDPVAATRLGRLISLRRHILAYRESHDRHLQTTVADLNTPPAPSTSQQRRDLPASTVQVHEMDKAVNSQPQSQAFSQQMSLPSKATTHRNDSSLDDESVLYPPSIAPSEASRASSYAVDHLQVEIPSMPKDQNGRPLTQFLCPYCSITQSIKSERFWKKHVLDDLRPYVCTFTGCGFQDHFFANRSEWFRHETNEHRSVWQCNVENHLQYEKQDEFLRHMLIEHKTNILPDQVANVESIFKRPSRSQEGECNLCMRDSKKLKSHVSRHLERIALFALPRVNETAGSGKAERDTRSSRYANKGDGNENKDDDDLQSSNASSESHRSDTEQRTEDLDLPDLPDDEFETVNIPETAHQSWDDFTAKFSEAREGKSAEPPRFKRTGDLKDLEIAVARGEEAVAATPRDHPGRAGMLSNLAVSLRTRFERTGDVHDLNMAIARGEEAVEATPRDHPGRAGILSNLAVSLRTRFERTGDSNDLNMAIARGEEAVATTPHYHPDRAGVLSNLAVSLRTRFEQTGGLNDLNMAIGRGGEAVEATPRDHPDRARRLSNLAVSLLTRFERSGDINDLNMAIERGGEAVETTPHDHPDRAAMLTNLANSLLTRFQRSGDVNDLNMAIERGGEAVEATPRDHPGRAGMLSDLAVSLRTRFERTGDVNDLNMAIGRGGEAVEATPRDHPDRARRLSNLAVSLLTRFERSGDINDLNMAIERGGEAVETTPHDHPDRAAMLTNLANSLRTRFQRSGDVNDLNMAIERGGEAVEATPRDHPGRAGMLSDLAVSLRTRFERTGDSNDLNMAIARGEEAVEATPHYHPDRAGILSNLAVSLRTRFEQTGDLNDLNMAIKRGEEAVEATPRDYPGRAGMLNNLANSLQIKFQYSGIHSVSERALSLQVEAAQSPNAPPRVRIESVSQAAEILANNKKWAEVSRITEIAVNLLPTVAPPQLKQQDRQHILGEFAGLAALAASAALEAGKEPSHAVQLLELGRGVIAGLRFGTRPDLTKLIEQYPEMAEKFERFRDILDSPSLSVPDPAIGAGALTSTLETNLRHDASLELDKTIAQIRRLPDFENFLRPPIADELKAAASRGPVVLINVSKYRCDAFLVERQAIRSIRLPDLRQSDIKENVKLTRSTRSAHSLSPDAKGQMSRMLVWLWDVAVRPILDELGFLGPPSNDNWPRIWWIPTGQLSLLPLHAAGRHFPSSTETVLDRVVSSYSPSIKALLHARQNSRKRTLDSASDEALLVSMDRTPGYSDLRFAREEANMLAGILPDSIPRVTLERPLREAVLAGLNTCTIFHFAGHGESHLLDPSKSSLLISDWQENPLTVEHLIGLNLSQKSPWLAYLSACSTSESQAENLHDEAIHLVAACQLAGFQHVVGSLWEVLDQYSVNAAEEVYKTIVNGGVVDGERIALGVHKAARRLRDFTQERGGERTAVPLESEGDDILESRTRTVRPLGYVERDVSERSDPLIWAAYIHVGP